MYAQHATLDITKEIPQVRIAYPAMRYVKLAMLLESQDALGV